MHNEFTFRSYCEYNCSTYDGEYVDVTIAPTSAAQLPAQPVRDGRTYQIAAGDGTYLAQSGDGLTTAGRSASATSQWKFNPTGDGFYTVTNAGTGQALGVDSNSDAGRAWGAPRHPRHARGRLDHRPAVVHRADRLLPQLGRTFDRHRHLPPGQPLQRTRTEPDRPGPVIGGDHTPAQLERPRNR